MSNCGGTSISSDTYLPFFLRWRGHSVSRYSICPLMLRKSSSAQAAIASYSFADTLKGICFFPLSAISVQAAAVYHRLCVVVAAQNYQQVTNHSGLSLFVQFHHIVFI